MKDVRGEREPERGIGSEREIGGGRDRDRGRGRSRRRQTAAVEGETGKERERWWSCSCVIYRREADTVFPRSAGAVAATADKRQGKSQIRRNERHTQTD